MKWLKLSVLVLSLLPIFYSTTAQADLKIGVIFFDPPLVISANQGFNIDLAHAICQVLQEKCLIMPTIWADVFTELDKGKIDLILGAYITPEREKKYLFSMPYMASKGLTVVPTKAKITQMNQLKGRYVGVVKEEAGSGVFFNYIQTNFFNWFTLKEFNNIDNLVDGLMNNSVQAAIMHLTAANYWLNNSNSMLQALGTSFTIGRGYGFLTLPSRQLLIDNINQALQKIKANGEFAKIYSTYF